MISSQMCQEKKIMLKSKLLRGTGSNLFALHYVMLRDYLSYAKKLCMIFVNLWPRHVADGLVASDTRIS